MAAIKLKPETIEVIDTLFSLASDNSRSDMPKEEWRGWVMKVQAAAMDWLGYKTFLDM